MDYLLKSPVNESDVENVKDHVNVLVNDAWNILQTQGKDALKDFMERNKYAANADDQNTKKKNETNDEDIDARVNGDARNYQMELFENAKVRNTIIALGTGTGKTLIALMLIRHFSGDFDRNKQTWFLVPSVALALQQANTIESNLPFSVGIACNTAAVSEKARKELANAQVLVATHGSALDLLRHYSDMFHLNRVNLLVIDECHYAIKKHSYAVLMNTFYHELTSENRPRILGLTASPIINLKGKGHTSTDDLELTLRDLERNLDSSLISLSKIGLDNSNTISNNIEERIIYFSGSPIHDPFYSDELRNLLPSRRKEIHQLEYLYNDLGASVTGLYVSSVIKEVSRNKYERETGNQFDLFIKYLNHIKYQCLNEPENNDGRPCKLIGLEHTLHNIFTSNEDDCYNGKDSVGIIFVKRRITALALQNYLNHKFSNKKDTDEHGIYCIKCDSLTRKNTHVFKYLNRSHLILSKEDKEKAHVEWLHTMKNIKKTLAKLRQRKINTLISTSVVEEGIDIVNCSFVIVLDGIETTKSYIQMKGRARSSNARFFVFQNKNAAALKVPITLNEAKQTEKEINSYIGTRETNYTPLVQNAAKRMKLSECTCKERNALFNGEYRATYGMVDLLSSKSLINRYACSVPMDLKSRSSRNSLLPYLPVYKDNVLRLPSHLPGDVRFVHLPNEFISNSKRKNESMLALMACVRLHERNVLNERLLPLRRNDILRQLYASVLSPIPLIEPIPDHPNFDNSLIKERTKIFAYPIRQSSDIFQQNEAALNSDGQILCILLSEPMQKLPQFYFKHPELGSVRCTFEEKVFLLSSEQIIICRSFFTVLMNARWRRRTGRVYFDYSEDTLLDNIIEYTVASLDKNNQLDWDYMQQIISEYGRSENDRKANVQQWQMGEKKPRIWAPIYDPNVSYITFRRSKKTCSESFPDPNIGTFQDYFQQKRSFKVTRDCSLFEVQRLWTMPQKLHDDTYNSFERTNKENYTKSTFCKGLVSVLLPQDACLETSMADPALCLHCVLLPQILYKIERHISTEKFLIHVSQNFPELNKCLKSRSIEEVMTTLTAKSCVLNISYDRLEYLGDAVLKIIHTDALIKSSAKDLQRWISCLHEGDLSALRSGLGCNERLKEAADKNRMSHFILTQPLGRGVWTPAGLEKRFLDQEKKKSDLFPSQEIIPSTKVKADVVEAILGLVYLFEGYEVTIAVAEELGLSTAQKIQEKIPPCSRVELNRPTLQFLTRFLGNLDFEKSSSFIEALTHASCVHSETQSYQRLEWIGDAVLCLAAREWVFKTYPYLEVKHLVLLETILICNETLAFLGGSIGLHKHIQHCDSSLPHRLEKYEINLKDVKHHGIWSEDAPKIIADAVESLLGAVHVQGNFYQGQNVTMRVLQPITKLILKNLDTKSAGLSEAKILDMMHPKQIMTEMCSFLSVKSWKEDDFLRVQKKDSVWNGVTLNNNYSGDENSIAQVNWFGCNMITVKDRSTNVALYKACALASALLKMSPETATKLNEMSKMMTLQQ